MFSAIRRNIILSLVLLLAGLNLYAGNDPEYRQTLFGKNGQLEVNQEVTTTDLNFEAYKNTPGVIEKTWYVKNAVRLMIDEESPFYAQSDFTATFQLEVAATNAGGTLTTVNKNLTLEYKKGKGLISGAITTYEFRDAVSVKVKILSRTINVAWDVTKNLKIVNEIIALRDWGFTCGMPLTGINTSGVTADEWNVRWDVPLNFQTEYDLEWAWVDESAIADYTSGGNVNMNLVFDNNATRISTDSNGYSIPLLYEDNGRLYARVRMAQKKAGGQRVEGNWYYLNDGGLAYLPRTTGHQELLNWQATTTFAEEGKRSTVIQYFDGTQRGRQTVTKDNVTGTTVVAESFYDYQGRPVIQVLPAPTLSTVIAFTRNFNQFDDNRYYKSVYDNLQGASSSCNQLTAKMLNTATGSASQYYSGQNPLKNTGFHQFIPDAGGYPYTETRFTNDGTGRVDAQGGVGPLFQVNGNRETKYFYESADQADLDALFGTNAGYASHYSKNWVRDANGQYSVSYVDMKGKTIATALAGDPPTNLKALPSYANAAKTVTRQLIDEETNNVHGNSIISSKSLMVPKAGNFQFNYSLSPEKLKMLLCTNTEFCFDCLYELNISIVPDCADKTIAGFTNPLVVRNFNLGEYLTSCAGNNAAPLTANFNVWLEEGAYTIVKELKLSTASRDWYRENVYLANDTCKTRDSFLLKQYTLALAQQNCYVTCTQCTTKLGTQQQFIDRFTLESGLPPADITAMMPQIVAAYNEARANCQQICDDSTGETLDEITSIRNIMLQDMTPPFGQYARRNDTERPNAESQPYNIFNPNPLVSLCAPQSGTRHPFKWPVNYNDYNGTVACAPGYNNSFGVQNISQAQAAAMDPEAFTDNFEDSYAGQLLYYHPEFCKLKFAETNLKGTYRFAGRLQTTETFAQAVSRNFINPALTDPVQAADFLMQKDSFFILLTPASPHYTSMRNAIISSYVAASGAPCNSPAMGMWKLAQMSVFCHKEIRAQSTQQIPGNGCLQQSAALLACTNSLTNLPPSSVNHCEADMNMVWKNFRALYMSYRNILVSKYLTDNCAGINYSIFSTSNGYNYQERFGRPAAAPPYTTYQDVMEQQLASGNPATYNTLAANEADSVCRANSGTWMIRLRRCTQVDNLANNNPLQWAADSAWLSKYLVKICSPGVDYMGHPFGAVSLPDGKPPVQITENPNGVAVSGVFVRSFPDLVKYYLNFRSIPINEYCYPELIDYPKAYNVAPPVVIVPIITTPEPCVCERINYFKIKWQNSGQPGTFSQYLAGYHGTSISQDTLDLLVAMCNTGYTSTNPNCNFLLAPVKLPAIFQCRGTANPDSSKTCITCADYTAIKQAFLTERGVAAPINEPQTDAEVALNQAFAAFANYRTGFSKLWPEYVAFGLQCTGNTTYDCKYLQSLVSQWQATNPPATGTACQNSFVAFMNNATGQSYTYQQWMQEFIKACGATPPVCAPVLTCDRFKSLINSYYNLYGFQVWRNVNCQQLFTTFINDSLQTSYTYDQVVNQYNFVCGGGCPLSPCSFPNPHLLTLMYNTYKALFPTPPPTVTQCQQDFTTWFNNQLGFSTTSPYSWDQIVALYKAYSIDCTPDLNQLCTPPYSCEQLNYVIKLFQAQFVPGPMIDCQAVFTAFFNDYMATNYTYLEIAGLYATICNQALNVCGSSTDEWDCKRLLQVRKVFSCNNDLNVCICFTDYFNGTFGTSYTYAQIQAIYLQHCNYVLNMCPTEPPVLTCEQLQGALAGYYKAFPLGGTPPLGTEDMCEDNFTTYFNGQLGSNLTFGEIYLQFLACGDTLRVCADRCAEYSNFINSYIAKYGNIQIPLKARQALFTALFNQAYGYNGAKGALNAPLVYTEIKLAISPCVSMPGNLEMDAGIYSLSNAAVLNDFKSAYNLMNPSGLPGDCRNDFTGFVNMTMGLNVSYDFLVNQYNNIVGPGSGNICGSGNLVSRVSAEQAIAVAPPAYPPLLCGLNVEILPPPPVDTSNCKDPWLKAVTDANIKYELYLDSLRNNFDTAWYNKCVRAKYLESFTVTYQKAEYHYTLYEYDQAGQLVRTIPPEGVDDRRADAAFLADVTAKRANVKAGGDEALNKRIPDHRLATDYRYNTLGQVVQQKTPDAGLSKFWYDVLGRLVVSQNAKQALLNRYSYTIYDELGRIAEVGQKPQTQGMDQTLSRHPGNLNTWLTATANREEITRTVYDISYFSGDDLLKPELLWQRHLRNRVSYMQVFNNQPAATWAGTHNSATYYSYDIHGNVDTLLQDFGNSAYHPNAMNTTGNRYKKMAYDFDLVSGKVNMITYQPGYVNANTGLWVTHADRFYHRYLYDGENKITDVYTSHDSLVWERDAAYEYYKHGPVGRMVLGQQQVQGVDYAYTLEEWIKGVNGTAMSAAAEENCAPGSARDTLDVYNRQQYNQPAVYKARMEINFRPDFDHDAGDNFETEINAGLTPCVPVVTAAPYNAGDMGEDGLPGGARKYVPRDAYSYSLNYYQANTPGGLVRDYTAINNTKTPFAGGMFNLDNIDAEKVAKPLFNGNIASMFVNIPQLGLTGAANSGTQLTGYAYDQLNRIVSMDAFGGFDNSTNGWQGGVPVATANYKERVSYDANGNILSYLRNGTAANGSLLTMDNLTYGYNKDGSNNLANNRLRHVKDAVDDANYQEDIDNQPDDNYDYDAIGNLVKDTKEGITSIDWTGYGKIALIQKTGNKIIEYAYDAAGNRINKKISSGGVVEKTTFYVRDARGNVMSVYEQIPPLGGGGAHLTQTEVYLYGSSRLGVYNINRDMEAPSGGEITNFERGRKTYELNNHLGNVLVTITDRKLPVEDAANAGQVLYYSADVATATDYYPFGMGMVGRKFSYNGQKNRYGFNGKENDNEIKGEGNQQDYGMRIYDTRAGKFLSVDPLAKSFPWNSSYAFAENDVLRSVDLDGLEKLIINEFYDKYGRRTSTEISGIRAKDTKEAVDMNMKSRLNVKLSKTDVYIIRQRNNSNRIFFEGTGGDLTHGLERQIKAAPTVEGENDNSLPNGTMRQTETTSRGSFYRSDLMDNTAYEFFGDQFNSNQPAPVQSGSRTAVSNTDFGTGSFNAGTLDGTSTGRYGPNTSSLIGNAIIEEGRKFMNERNLNVGAVESITLTVPNRSMPNLTQLRRNLASQFNIRLNRVSVVVDPDINAKDAGVPIGSIRSTPGLIHVDATYSGVGNGNHHNAEQGHIRR